MLNRQSALLGLLVCCWGVCAPDNCYGQYQPYGAWRGRVRHVEGPFRTKDHARWGAGITPTGGSVLVQGLHSAESVFTNPNVIGALGRASDAAHRSKFDSQIKTIDAKNDALTKQIDAIASKHKFKIETTPVRPDRPTTGSVDGVGAATSANEEFESKIDELVSLVKLIGESGSLGLRLQTNFRKGNYLKTKVMPPLSANERERVESQLVFVQSVFESMDRGQESSDVTSTTKFNEFDSESVQLLGELRQLRSNFATKLAEARMLGEKLKQLEVSFSESVDKDIEAARQRLTKFEQWKLPAGAASTSGM